MGNHSGINLFGALEAQRLGLRAIATDLNPVAVMINKALVEIPPRFAGAAPVSAESKGNGKLGLWKGAEGLAEDVRTFGCWMRDEAKKRIGHFYPDICLPKEAGGGTMSAMAWLWVRTVPSPNPAFASVPVPLASTFWLTRMKGREAWIKPIVKGKSYSFEVRTGPPEEVGEVEHGTKLGRGANFRCILSGSPIEPEYVKSQAMAGRLGMRLLAVIGDGAKGRVFVSPTPEAEEAGSRARPEWTPEEALPNDPRNFWIVQYGLSTYGSLFTARQLVALNTFASLVQEAADRAVLAARKASWPEEKSEAYGKAIGAYLAMTVGRLADRSSTLCTWDAGPAGTRTTTGGSAKTSSIRNTFARQALSMSWDFAESSPFTEASGGFESALKWTVPAIRALGMGPPAEVTQEDAVTSVKRVGAVISTDPPYYDNITYADLSDFFYIWLRRCLRPQFPSLFATVLVPKSAELIATPYRHGSKQAADQFFMDGMFATLRSINAAAEPDGVPVVLYYAFKQSEGHGAEGSSSTGWESFLTAVLESGLAVDGTWPLRTELTNRMVGIGTNSLASSIVLVCRRRPEAAPTTTRGEFRRALRKELPDALRKLQQGNIAPVDVAQASIGPGMAIFSRHRMVAEADGSAMSVRAALQLINEVLDEYLSSGEGDFDADTRFAITWHEQHGWEPGPYGDAENIAKARNISVQGVVEAGVCRSGAGKVRLLKRNELPAEYDLGADERPTVWEFTQHMIRYLEDQGEEAAARHMKRLGSRAEATRELAYRLYNTCERKKWADDARAYNGLILAWPELEKLAARMSDEAPPPAPSKPAKKGKKSKTPTKGQQDLFEGDEK